jgi:hypothetical protein
MFYSIYFFKNKSPVFQTWIMKSVFSLKITISHTFSLILQQLSQAIQFTFLSLSWMITKVSRKGTSLLLNYYNEYKYVILWHWSFWAFLYSYFTCLLDFINFLSQKQLQIATYIQLLAKIVTAVCNDCTRVFDVIWIHILNYLFSITCV